MIKTSNKQPSPQSGTKEPSKAPKTETVIEMRPAKGTRKGFFEKESIPMTEAAANKAVNLSEAKQKLAEARDLWEAGQDKDREAEEAASKGAILLYSAITNKAVQPNELSPILGDQFGYKQKGKDSASLPPVTAADKNASKTPYGHGEVLRKRLVRMIGAHTYVNGGDGGKFFEGLPVDDVRTVLKSIETGEVGIWGGYSRFADIKKAATEKPAPLAFNPSRIAGIAESLSADGAAANFQNNKALRDAYLELWGVLEILSQEIAEMDDKATGTNG